MCWCLGNEDKRTKGTYRPRQGQGLVERNRAHGDGVAEVGGGEAELLAVVDDHGQGHEAVLVGVVTIRFTS